MIAKEIRGMQLDQLVTTLTDEEKLEIDPRKLARARFLIRDLDDILLPDSQAEANRRNRSATQAEVTAQQKEQLAADIRKTLSDAFKNIAQGQKNTANADAATVKSVLELLERGLEDAASTNIKGSSAGTGGEPAQAA
jgi:flagellar hook-basal body complex protein FliE